MKKTVLSLCCITAMNLVSQSSFAHNIKSTYTGKAYTAGIAKIGKLGISPTDVIVINNTPNAINISAPGINKDYLAANAVYRITSNSTISPQIILANGRYGDFYNNFVQPHSIVSYSEQNGAANVIAVEYYQ